MLGVAIGFLVSLGSDSAAAGVLAGAGSTVLLLGTAWAGRRPFPNMFLGEERRLAFAPSKRQWQAGAVWEAPVAAYLPDARNAPVWGSLLVVGDDLVFVPVAALRQQVYAPERVRWRVALESVRVIDFRRLQRPTPSDKRRLRVVTADGDETLFAIESSAARAAASLNQLFLDRRASRPSDNPRSG